MTKDQFKRTFNKHKFRALFYLFLFELFFVIIQFQYKSELQTASISIGILALHIIVVFSLAMDVFKGVLSDMLALEEKNEDN